MSQLTLSALPVEIKSHIVALALEDFHLNCLTYISNHGNKMKPSEILIWVLDMMLVSRDFYLWTREYITSQIHFLDVYQCSPYSIFPFTFPDYIRQNIRQIRLPIEHVDTDYIACKPIIPTLPALRTIIIDDSYEVGLKYVKNKEWILNEERMKKEAKRVAVTAAQHQSVYVPTARQALQNLFVFFKKRPGLDKFQVFGAGSKLYFLKADKKKIYRQERVIYQQLLVVWKYRTGELVKWSIEDCVQEARRDTSDESSDESAEDNADAMEGVTHDL